MDNSDDKLYLKSGGDWAGLEALEHDRIILKLKHISLWMWPWYEF